MAGFDFWRVDLAPSDELDQLEAPGAAESVTLSPLPPATSLSWTRPERQEPAKPEEVGLRQLESALGLDEAAIKETGSPVPLASLGSYLASLQLDGAAGSCTVVRESPVTPCVQGWAAGKLAQVCGADAVPQEMMPAAAAARTSIRVDSLEAVSWEATASTATAQPDAPPPAPAGWRALFAGSLVAPEPHICGLLRPVPQLPSPLTIVGEVPSLLEQMLEQIPQHELDTKQFRAPASIEGFPTLCRGPGGLLPSYTPRQLAQNMLAAAILNRLCSNLLIAIARGARARGKGSQATPEEAAVAAAQKAIVTARETLQKARQEENSATGALKAFQAAMETDMDKQRELESIVGWKSSVREQAEREMQEAEGELRVAQEALAVALRKPRSEPWHQQWACAVPESAADEQLFSCRLSAKGALLYTIKDFVEALQQGLVDRSGGGFVTKHTLESAFVRHASDSLLLCTSKGEGTGSSEVFTHLPTPATVGTGIAEAGAPKELRAPRPHHAFLMKVEGQTFPFTVSFGPTHGSGLGFVGTGTHETTYSTPWNPLEYGDILWAQEAQEGLGLVSAISAVACLVTDPALCLGVFPALQSGAPREVPLGTAGVALLQAALFNDVKLWPVAMPEAARGRWDLALRSLRHMLAQPLESEEASQAKVGLDDFRDEVFPKLLEVLRKVPNDDGGAGDNASFADRVKRMELSALTRLPLASARAFRQRVEDLLTQWPRFTEDTGS